MSTRCQILFTDGDTSLLTYKHSDGYPSEVIPLLRDYWRWYPRTESLEYLTATWFYYCKRQRENQSIDLDWCDAPMATDELDYNHPVALSYGICADNEMHGDTEHFYEVDIEQETIAHYTEGMWFDGVDSPADITTREPDGTYSLTRDRVGGSSESTQSAGLSVSVTDGGQTNSIKDVKNIVKASELIADEPFDDENSPQDYVDCSEEILDELDGEIQTDFDEGNRLFFVDVVDSEYTDAVEVVLDTLEQNSSYIYRESERNESGYEATYIGEFTQYTTPTTGGEEDER